MRVKKYKWQIVGVEGVKPSISCVVHFINKCRQELLQKEAICVRDDKPHTFSLNFSANTKEYFVFSPQPDSNHTFLKNIKNMIT